MSQPFESYWANRGRFQAAADALEKRIPHSGPIPNAESNPALERYRQAVNCYYDLFNNGLCNRAAEFRALFGLGLPREPHSRRLDYSRIEAEGRVDAAMNVFVIAAAEEQGIKWEVEVNTPETSGV